MRITKTFRNGECHTLRTCCAPYYKKLSQLEDIEEELGIDLIKLFDCIRNGKGIWKRKYGDSNELINTRCMLTCEFGYWRVYDRETIYELKDYGKTWALTKEELKC